MHPLSNDKVPVLKTPPLSGSDTAVQATSPRLSVDAVSQTSTDIHPLISLSEVSESPVQRQVDKSLFKTRVAKFSGRRKKKGVAGTAMTTLQWQRD